MGTRSTAVGWNTEDCQNLRFHKLSDHIKDSSYSINDYGCGYGSHLTFLKNVLGHKITEYNGYDISEDMLIAAKKNLKNFKGNLNLFNKAKIDTKADYSFVSGTFNVCFQATKEEWKKFIIEKLNEINSYSEKGFSFNMLTSYVDWEEDHLFYGDPNFWFDYCKRKFSKKVSLLHDYDLWEWTIIVKK